MDITSPTLLKIKGALFLLLGLLSAGLLLIPSLSLEQVILFAISVWSFCRAYYFCFYVLEHYAGSSRKYAGLWDLMFQWLRRPKVR